MEKALPGETESTIKHLKRKNKSLTVITLRIMLLLIIILAISTPLMVKNTSQGQNIKAKFILIYTENISNQRIIPMVPNYSSSIITTPVQSYSYPPVTRSIPTFSFPTLKPLPYSSFATSKGSYYGQISSTTGRSKTVHVNGYIKANGTYVGSYFRSSSLRH